jgi:DNA-binding transcriptional regulator GbsR (MarR family)
MNDARHSEEQQFVEEFGIVFEEAGLPRMAGRIMGYLLLSSPPHKSIDELSTALMASKGSISTMTRLLIQSGIIERISLPGVRHDYFRIKPDALGCVVKYRAEQISAFRKLAERGLELVGAKATPVRQALEEMRDMYVFIEREFPALMERWEKERKKRRTQSVKQGGSE